MSSALTDPLTAKQETFCRLMAADLDGNARRAAEGAGFAANSAHVTASRMLQMPKIQRRIAELREGVIAMAQSPAVVVPVQSALETVQAAPVVLEGEVMTGPLSREEEVIRAEGAAAEVIRELQWLSYSDVTDVFDEARGDLFTLADLKALPRNVRRCIRKVKVRTDSRVSRDTGQVVTETTYELELWDKPTALRMLAQVHGLLREVIETRNLTVEDAIREARKLAGLT